MKSRLPKVALDKTDNILSEFFVKDRKLTPSGHIRNSTLLACKRDYLFLRGAKLTDPPLNLNKNQEKIVLSKLPSFATILIYCSAIDLLARIMKGDTPNNKSKDYFLWSARRWFERTPAQSLALWKMRCAMSHQYKIERGQKTISNGFSGSIRYNRQAGKWVFNLNGMLGDIRHAIKNSHDYIIRQSLPTRNKYAQFVYEHGFFYTNSNL